MMRDFRETLREVVQSILPITVVIVILELTLLHTTPEAFIQFLFGTALATLGIVLFLVGVRVGMLPMGEAIGSELPNRGSIFLIVFIALIFGFIVTIAEPDVRVLTGMIENVSNGGIAQDSLIVVIAVGVGFFVATALLRIISGVPIAYLLGAGYTIVLLLSLFTPAEFISIAFDAGGVTTGPLTVPVILALGLGISSVLGGRSAISDGFGLIGLASIGPIIGVMAVGVLFQ